MSDIKKILVFGDLHADESTPKSRKDDYLLAICAKLEEIVKLANAKKVDAVISLGDIFTRMEPSGKCRNMIISLLQLLNPEINIYVTEGNHDIKNAPSNLYKSALGTLIETDVVKHTDYIKELGIRLGHWVPAIEQLIKEGKYQDECVIHTFHANISDVPMMFQHILFQDVTLHPNCKLVLGGHIHRYMADEKDGVKFISPGPICRDEMNDYLVKYKPKVLYVEYTLDGSYINTELLPLQNVGAAADVFRLEEGKNKKDEKDDTKQYIQEISQLSSWSFGADKYDSLRKSGQMKKIEQPVVDLAIETLTDVNEK